MKAISYNLLAWAILPFMDTIAKYLSADISFFQITWARYFFSVFFALPFMFFFFRKNLICTTQPKLQFFIGLTLFFANVLFFYSISIISMAEALTLAFVAPLITTALSPFFLDEKVGIRRWSAVIIGFIGSLIVIRPGFIEFNLATVAAVLTIAGYSINDTVVIYDRIRDSMRKYKQVTFDEVINISLNGTLSRTVTTSVTTLLALIALYIFGGIVISSFIIALIWGVLIGTYSSLYVASPILTYMKTSDARSKNQD